MEQYSICNNYLEIIAGTSNRISPAYMEAASNVDKDTKTGLTYLKNFITDIEKIASKDVVKDERISKSRGNIRNFSAYENIKSALSFLKKNLGTLESVKECDKVFESLERYQSLYTDAYDKNVRLVVLEYENSVYLLVTSLSMIMANNMDVVSNGTEIRIQKKSATTFGIIPKTLKDLAKQLTDSKHRDYLEELINAVNNKEISVNEYTSFTEASIGDTIELISALFNSTGKIVKAGANIFKSIKNTMFGIIPLIRSIIYLRYKKKADTILSLEQQVEFIQRNIEQLENMKNMDPKKKEIIIKKQQAVCEQYRKKAEKLRAELCETEKAAATEIKKENPKISSKHEDDDFVLESSVFGYVTEGKKPSKFHFRNKANRSKGDIEDIRRSVVIEHNFVSKNATSKKSEFSQKEIEEKCKRAMQKMFDDTAVKSIRLTPGSKHDQDDPKKRKVTKIGGIPYWPKDKEWPMYGKDKPMICLAQLNLSELPKLEGYPSTGLLQFFIYSDECWQDEENCMVIHHTETDATDLLDIPPRSTIGLKDTNNKYDEDDYAPIQGVYYPTASVQKIGIQSSTEYTIDGKCDKLSYSDLLCKYLNAEFGTDWKTWSQIPNEVDKVAWKIYCELNESYGTRLGGYPSFTQFDPRDKKHSILLLQLDSEAGMMWGDCGIANFFISKEDLARNRFDHVMFTWDCC